MTGAGLEPSTPSGRRVPALSSPAAHPHEPSARRAGPGAPALPCTGRASSRTAAGSFPAAPGGVYSFPSAGLLPPFLYFRFLPAPQEPKEPAAPRGVSSLGRRGSALPAVLLGAAPEHRAGTKQGETLPFGSVPQGLTALGGLRRANHVTPRQAARHPTSPPPALPGWEWGLGTGRATHRGQPRGLNVPAVSRPGPPEGLEGVGSGNLSRGLSKGPAT